jgi:hypothetical protein
MHDVVPVEYGQETFYRSGSVARPGLNVFPQDAPSVLNGAHQRILVGIIHDGTQLHETGIQDWGGIFVPLGAAVLCLGDHRD